MNHRIGFESEECEWSDSVSYVFERFSDHTRTTRFKCALERSVFSVYVPGFIEEEVFAAEKPRRVSIEIGRPIRRSQTIGFNPPSVECSMPPGTCVYQYSRDKVHSRLYHLEHNDQMYGLYVPNEVFGEQDPPDEMYLRLERI